MRAGKRRPVYEWGFVNLFGFENDIVDPEHLDQLGNAVAVAIGADIFLKEPHLAHGERAR